MLRNMGASELLVIIVAVGALFLPGIFYLLSLQKCLSRCAVENRAMSPGLVWLMLIPIFNMVWHFFIVFNVSKSVGSEYKSRGIRAEPNPGQALGLAMCGLSVCGIIPIVGLLAGFAGFICWIIYWVKVAGFSSQLAALPAGDSYSSRR